MRVLLGVTGGIAAYKVATVVRRLTQDGHTVRVVPTAASLNFVGRATWEALSAQPATSDTFANVPSVEHVRLGQGADVVLVAPATADFLAAYAHGEARDLLGNALLATAAPVVVAPAMHTEMWLHPATQANVATLRARGVHVIEPAVGRLTGPDSGPGRLPEPEDLLASLYAIAAGQGVETSSTSRAWGDLADLRVVITAGGTREPIDAVRFLGNHSTGHQGFALAEAARERGAQVRLIAANTSLPAGEGIEVRAVSTTAELDDAVREEADDADVVIMAAAVADFRPDQVADVKIKKNADAPLTLTLVPTQDILAGLVQRRAAGQTVAGQTVVGFGAETGDANGSVVDHGRAKAIRKGADLLVVNPVGNGVGFGDVPNTVTMFTATGDVVATAAGTKLDVAHAIWDRIAALRASSAASAPTA